MEASSVFLLISVSFVLSMIVVPIQIKKFREKGIVVTDYYKKDLRKVPTSGGFAVLFVFFLMFGLATVLGHFFPIRIEISDLDRTAMLVIGLFGLFGAIDDFVDVGRASKIFLPFFFSYPLAFVMDYDTVVLPLLGKLDLGMFFLFLIAPTYVMVVSNLVNMHSGFNGMAAGLSAILLSFLLIKSVMAGRNCLFTLSCMLGALLGFLYYNWYPSRIFDGNVGALSIGAAIGVGIVACGFLVSGFIMLLPHTVNFLMYVYWRVMRKLHPDDGRWKLVKFGRVRDDGTLEVPNALTLKWVLPYHFRMTEKQVVLAMYGLTLVFCVIGLFIPY